MKTIIRTLIINTTAIAVSAYVIPGISYNDNPTTLIVTSLALTLVNLLVKPIIKLLMLPLNLLTLGLLAWLVDMLMLYIVTLIVPGFQIEAFKFSGVSFAGIIIPEIYFNRFFSFFASSFLLSLTSSFLHWVIK